MVSIYGDRVREDRHPARSPLRLIRSCKACNAIQLLQCRKDVVRGIIKRNRQREVDKVSLNW